MKNLVTVLFFVFVLHIVISLAFILDPPFLSTTRLARVYKTYLLPGPFFTESRIVDNYMLFLSWKVKGEWESPINPAVDQFKKYHAHFNPRSLYQSRLERTIYARVFLEQGQSEDKIKDRKEYRQLYDYLRDHYVPKAADSVRMIIINKQARNFNLKVDSVYVILSK